MMADVGFDRERLRATFDEAAAKYERARPDYPSALYDELIRLACLDPGDHLLEIGCATGKATRPLAERGFDITCIELGEALATAGRANLARFPNVTVVHGDFEDWLASTGTFDLVFAATSWHWIDPTVRYRLAAQQLRPGGHLAFWSASHVVPDDGDTFFRDIQPTYEEIGEGLPPDAQWFRPGELPDCRAEIEASGFFDQVEIRHFDWEVIYSADRYIDLLDTFSGHIAMQPWQRARLHTEIRRRLDERADHRLRRHWGAVLHVATRRS
jgi:SAM-dependent methyltransferase